MARRSSKLPAAILFLVVALAAGGTLWVLMTPPPPADTVQPATGLTVGEKASPAAKTEQPAAAAAPAPSAAAPPPPISAPPPGPAEIPSAPPPAAKAMAAKPSPQPAIAVKKGAEPGDQTPSAVSRPTPPPPVAVVVAPPIATKIPRLARKPKEFALPVAPDPELTEPGPAGPLPVVGRDGREAWRVYARPFRLLKERPMISLVLYGLGPSSTATRAAIQGLPGSVTLAFSPYTDDLSAWIAEARAAGHETLLMVPMEPTNFPQFDPGPKALLTTLESTENIARFEWVLGRARGYVGITNFMGSRFTNSPPHFTRLLEAVKKRGLLYLESRPVARIRVKEIANDLNVPFAGNMMYIDSRASRDAIDGQLRQAETMARELGRVVVMGYPYPVTLERVARWAATVEKRGIALAPVSAMAARKTP